MTFTLNTIIRASPEVCFDLARSVDAHVASASATGERVVDGPRCGVLALGDEVTWEAVHFGVRQRLRVRITELDPPHRFVDEMIHGAFAWMRHVHTFSGTERETTMIDEFSYGVPFGLAGRAFDVIVLRRHMMRFLEARNRVLKALAERQFEAHSS